MILVDTSVWIEFLKNRDHAAVRTLITMIENEESIAFSGVILQELLQGCPDETSANRVEKHFAAFVEIFPQRSTYKLAAQIYRDCRKRGYIIRSSIDCLLAACALENNCAVLHKDRDYTHIAKISKLNLVHIA